MNKSNKTIKLLSYINNPMSKEGIAVLYTANNIRFERCELYSDYIQSLLALVFDTYMGDDITDSIQQINHFKWCWGKNKDNFIKEGVNIDDPRLYSYFLEFMMEVYYPLTKKMENDNIHSNIFKLWKYVLDYNTQKSNADMDTMIEVYKLFDNSLKKTG